MYPDLAIILPTLKRQVRLKWLVDNIHQCTKLPSNVTIYFVVEDDDLESIAEINRIKKETFGVELLLSPYRHINKAMNLGYRSTKEPLIYLACDDLEFTHCWFETAYSCLETNPQLQVVGTWDGFTGLAGFGNSGYLIKREYLDTQSGVIDQPKTIYNEDYWHFYADTEFFYTSKFRGVFRHCRQSVVHHRHYTVNPGYVRDETAIRNETGPDDKVIYNSRCHLFCGPYEV